MKKEDDLLLFKKELNWNKRKTRYHDEHEEAAFYKGISWGIVGTLAFMLVMTLVNLL